MMYGVDGTSDSLYTVNLATGAWTLVGPTGTGGPRRLGWNPDTGVMYGISGGFTDALYTVNLITGAWTLVGPTGVASPIRIGVRH